MQQRKVHKIARSASVVSGEEVQVEIDALLLSAIDMRASDIHLQPTSSSFRVRYRIDGRLYDQPSWQREDTPPLLSRLKILAGLDIAQRRLPQDGSFALSSENRSFDVRVATFPTVDGEKMVLRVLPSSSNFKRPSDLGFDSDLEARITDLFTATQGMFLVTGPTGSGKTTTLYALLSQLDTCHTNIVTIEDPVEYHLSGIMQSQVNEKVGLVFENGLRALLRQDPDVIMVGEIRDRITAKIAVEASLTGHLVLSTLHTGDAPSAICRLLEMGIEPYLLHAALKGVLCQRLVRRLCLRCKETDSITQYERDFLRQNTSSPVPRELMRARGCRDCYNLGYKGRLAVGHMLTVDDSIRDAIMQKVSLQEMGKLAVSSGMRELRVVGLQAVLDGHTTIDEVLCKIG